MKQASAPSVMNIRELQASKEAARLKDLADLRAGVPGEVIAERNCCVPVQQVVKARIVFA
jgi:hypothetical protein